MKFNKSYIKYIILVIISIVSIIFVYNDYFLYKSPIVKITNIENDIVDGYEYYNQNITGIVMNGEYKGREVTAQNTTSISGVYDEQIHKNSELFVELDNSGNVMGITNIKRDKYIAILLVLFIGLIIIVAKLSGLKTLLSLLINIIITIISIKIFQDNYKTLSMLLLYIIVSILFITTSLFITNGKSKKTLSAIISSIVSLFVSFAFAFIVIKLFGKNISIWTIDYIEAVYDYENFFYVSILLCGLGAIMDISITMSSSINELIDKDNRVSINSLIKSGKEIGKDVVGTMINVMLFTVYTPVIPSIYLAIKNGMVLSYALSFYGEIDLIIVLCSSISIVLCIPISLYISVFILKSRLKEEQK